MKISIFRPLASGEDETHVMCDHCDEWLLLGHCPNKMPFAPF